MDNLPKSISFSESEITKYLLLKTDMAIFDIDYQTQDKLLVTCNNFYKKNRYNLRIYKTSNGYRVFLTNQKFNIIKDFKLLCVLTEELEADIRYLIYSVRKNSSFTARIAPKNINVVNVATMKQLINEFENYKNNLNKGVTRYVTSIGDGIILEEFNDFIREHDDLTKAFKKDCILV